MIILLLVKSSSEVLNLMKGVDERKRNQILRFERGSNTVSCFVLRKVRRMLILLHEVHFVLNTIKEQMLWLLNVKWVQVRMRFVRVIE